uniref:Uncharacterized protein n=1 Tax=Magallana gigas TaxID=29159 RepID=K1QRL0_MAGGI
MSQDGKSFYWGRFLCPTDRSMRGDKTYCCGKKGQQYCCTFWEDAGRVVGVLFGLLVIVGIVGITVYCCKKRFNRYRWNRAFFRTPSKDPHQIPPDVKHVPMVGSSTGDALYTAPQNDIYPSCAPPPYELACKSSGDLPCDPNSSIKKPQKTPNGCLPYSTAPLFNGPHPEIPVWGALGRPKLRTRLTAKYGQPFCWGQCLELQAGRVVPITKIKENVVPEVCYNDKYDKAQDGNSTYLGRFLCPTDGSMRGDMCYCCGEEGQQYCCTFWGDGGRVAGVVLGVLVLVAIVFTTCYCCVNKGSPRSTSFLRTPSKNEYQLAQT